MERPVFKPVGTPVEELDTPALVVDLEALEHNIRTVHGTFERGPSTLRPDASAHLCPALANMQLAVDGTAGGVAVSTLGEAEVFAQNGIDDILIANLLVTDSKMARACAIARRHRLTVTAERQDHVGRLSEAAARSGATLEVLVHVRSAVDGIGCGPGPESLSLANAIDSADGLTFAGLFADAGHRAAVGPNPVLASLEPVLGTKRDLEVAGLPVASLCVVGSDDLVASGGMDGVTEVVAGFYALMDQNHGAQFPSLQHAAKLLATVISHPEPDIAWVDTGQKATSIDTGLPVTDGAPGATVTGMSAEHGGLALEGDAQGMYEVGDKVWLVPSDIGNTANVYDYIQVARGGRLEAIWEVAARGQYR
jgi:D-serine deaminase-like pyridoxal phosphate-dependent protein